MHPPSTSSVAGTNHVSISSRAHLKWSSLWIYTYILRMYICIYVCMCICMYVFTHTRTTHTYIHSIVSVSFLKINLRSSLQLNLRTLDRLTSWTSTDNERGGPETECTENHRSLSKQIIVEGVDEQTSPRSLEDLTNDSSKSWEDLCFLSSPFKVFFWEEDKFKKRFVMRCTGATHCS